MPGRATISAALGALFATLGALLGSVVAGVIGLSSLGLALNTLIGGLLGSIIGILASLVLPGGGALRPGGPSAPPPPRLEASPRASSDVQVIVAAIERLASGRSSQLALEDGDASPEVISALQQLVDRLAEDRRRSLQREGELRETSNRDAATLRHIQAELEALKVQRSAAKRVRDAFLTRMSHELRTPLNAILGYLEMLEEDVEDEMIREDLARVRSSAMTLLAIVTTVLDLTQLETGSFEVIPEWVDLKLLVRKVAESVQSEASANGNQLDVTIPDELEVFLDRRMLQSILFNLTANACKYTREGQVALQVREVDERLHILVADTGIGMTKRQIQEAYRPFGQGDDSTTRRYDGAGLGLSVVRGFAEAMGGSVGIDSELGKGARVEVELPMACEARVVGLDDDEPTMLLR
ncbi:MAG TPA: HAMP domain-containing histidine kinase [Deltaproteobacteria bacterium]|nr:HAMP domain-containing histidine kinase [Deltaproteobacteria bacterium]